MKQHMNKHNRRTSSKKSAGGTLIGLFVGLVIGVVAAAVVVWYIQRTPPPFANKPPTTPQSSQNTAPVALPDYKSDNTASHSNPDQASHHVFLAH